MRTLKVVNELKTHSQGDSSTLHLCTPQLKQKLIAQHSNMEYVHDPSQNNGCFYK